MSFELFVSGIPLNMEEEDIAWFFSQFASQPIWGVYLPISQNPNYQNAIINFSTYSDMVHAMDEVNFRCVSNFLIKAHPNTKEVWDNYKNPKANVAIDFPKSFDMDILTERSIYKTLKQFGPIISIKIMKDIRFVFCQFAYESSATKAIGYPCLDGVKIKPKTNKKSNKTSFKSEDFPTFNQIDQKSIMVNKPKRQVPKLQMTKMERPIFQVNSANSLS